MILKLMYHLMIVKMNQIKYYYRSYLLFKASFDSNPHALQIKIMIIHNFLISYSLLDDKQNIYHLLHPV